MHKKNLLFALLINVLMVLGLLYFAKPNAPIDMNYVTSGQISVICLAALAWIALLFFSNKLTVANQAVISSAATLPIVPNLLAEAPLLNTNHVSSKLTDLLNTIETEFNLQIKATQAELAQVKSLMDDAIDDLVDSFISLEATTRIGQNVMMQLVASHNDNNADELNPFKDKQIQSKQLLQDTSEKITSLIKSALQNEADCLHLDAANNHIAQLQSSSKLLSEQTQLVAKNVASVISENDANIAMVADEILVTSTQIEQDVQMAVKSLQFQDMTTQLIVQCGERQKIMQQMLAAVHELSIENTTINTEQDWQTKLALATEELKQVSKIRMKQFNVNAGSVELF